MAKAERILVVDDDPRLVRLVKANLEPEGYQVLAVADGSSALEAVEREDPDLILLDLMLPGMDGYELCQRIREFSDTPVIMLTARGEDADKVRGLRLGADDYITKPFSIGELMARVEAVLRRTRSPEEAKAPSSFTAGDLSIDFSRRRVTVRGEEVYLTPTEYRLLYHLATNQGRVMLHEELLTRVWGPEYREELEYLRAYIHHLRQKIEPNPAQPQLILSKPGLGYLLS